MPRRNLIIALTLTTLGFTQSGPPSSEDSQRLVRFIRIDQTNGHFINDCILLLPDGHYRREHEEEQPGSFSRTPLNKSQAFEVHVFEGQLTPEESSKVHNIVDRSEFRTIRTPGKLHMSSEFLEMLVLRQGEIPQTFKLSAAADYKPNENALKPIFAWVKSMEHRKHDVSKSDSDSCRISDDEIAPFRNSTNPH